MHPLVVSVHRVDALHPALSDLEGIDALCFAPSERTCIAQQLAQPFTRAWAACIDTALNPRAWVGHIVTWHVADELHILNVATSPQFRRRGVGAALVAEAVRFAKHHQVRLVLLEARRSNLAAIRLYSAFGFEQTGIRAGYYSDNGEDAVEMMLVVDPSGAV